MNFSFQLLNNDKNSWCVFCYNCSRNLFNTLPSNPKISTMPPFLPFLYLLRHSSTVTHTVLCVHLPIKVQ